VVDPTLTLPRGRSRDEASVIDHEGDTRAVREERRESPLQERDMKPNLRHPVMILVLACSAFSLMQAGVEVVDARSKVIVETMSPQNDVQTR